MMNTGMAPTTAQNTDAALVSATLAGDREAFGHIVARYQTLICSLAYSGTGSLSQSEDLAQETFVAAWKQLANLREPEHLRAWLCGIARNLINNSLRKQVREPSSMAESIEEISADHSPEPLPVDRTISNEEQAILWRSLEKIPEIYREPLVLFYREHQSVETVAEKLEINPSAVHQRLSRGRKLLAEEVAAFVESALERTNPGKAFTLGVLAALPLSLATSAKAAAVAAAAAKGGATATGTTFASIFGVLIGPALGLLGGYLGLKLSLKSTRTPRQRALVKRFAWTIFAAVIAFVVAFLAFMNYAGPLWKHHPKLFITLLLTIPAVYGAFIFYSSTRFNRIMTQLSDEEWQANPKLFEGYIGLGGMYCQPWEYRSRATLLGLPLIHCRAGRVPGQKPLPAIGWIAYGEKSYGILFAGGAVAVGGIAMGGVSVGIISFGGLSAGLLAFGGLTLGGIAMGGAAVGLVATGGIALAWHAAFGGVAGAHELACGGAVLASHVNDDVARDFFARHRWLDFTQAGTRELFWTLCFLPVVFQFVVMALWHKLAKRAKTQSA